MKRALLAAALLSGGGCSADPPPANGLSLVVVCSVDQLATWVFDAGLPFFRADGGFRRLLDGGVRFPACAYLHGCTETGPGHATIGTGAPARAHGIARNQWFEPATGRSVYCANDPTAKAVAAFREGRHRGPRLLRVPTVGDVLKEQRPDSRVVSVSCKDRSAVLMAGRSADAVVWFEISTGRMVTSAAWGDEAPAWLVAFDETAPADALFGWTWDRFGPEAAYADCVDDRRYELPHTSSGERTLPVVLTGGRDEPGPSFYNELYLSSAGNELILRTALAALEGESLGADAAPDLLCVSFSANDTVGHTFGPESVEARDALLRLDDQLARLFAALDERVGKGRWACVLTADHGVGPTPESRKAQGLDAGRGLFHLRARSAASSALRKHYGADGPFVLQASEQSVYLHREHVLAAARAQGESDADRAMAAARRVVADAVVKVPGVERAYPICDLLGGEPGDDPLRRALWFGACAGRAGDVVMVFKPYWIEGATVATHGSPHPYDRQVPLLAFGPGLRSGHESPAEISPGLAAVLAAHWLELPALEAAVDEIPADAMAR